VGDYGEIQFGRELYARLRNGGSQFVRVEHVHVKEGGQAVIGNVKP
jgi:hypothetical protein